MTPNAEDLRIASEIIPDKWVTGKNGALYTILRDEISLSLAAEREKATREERKRCADIADRQIILEKTLSPGDSFSEVIRNLILQPDLTGEKGEGK